MRSLRALVLGILCAHAIGSFAACRAEPPAAPAAAEALLRHYQRWEREQGDRGAELRIALRFAKGVSVAGPELGGSASIDRDRGRVAAEVFGLEQPAELWLIDNRPAPSASALPEAGDARILAGTLTPAEAGPARLDAQLEAGALRDFEIDRVVLCRAGVGPERGILITGAPTTFERLAARTRNAPATGATAAATGTAHPDLRSELGTLAQRGRELFERETFAGNGRSCATCHPSLHNFTLDANFIATLPKDDPLFVAERVPALAQLENPLLMRSRALILENLDGFDRPGVMRGVPHMLALATSIRGPEVPFDNTLNPDLGVTPPAERTGWSGDGAPGSGALREFAIGAVIQHFPRTLARVPGQDFRLPTDEELDALEIFQLSLGRSEEVDLAQIAFRDPLVRDGAELFSRIDTEQGTQPAGKCALCHSQAGANIDSAFFSRVLGVQVSGNANFGTGVNDLPGLPADRIDPEHNPRDGGFARVPHDGSACEPPRGGFGTVTPEGGALPPDLCEEDFNTPPLIEAADTPPFFHSNAVDSLELAVEFYDGEAFNDSAGGQLLASLDSGGIGIALDTTDVAAIGRFLRALNALENIREAGAQARAARALSRCAARDALARARAEQRDAVQVLAAVGLHADATAELRRAGRALERARTAFFGVTRRRQIDRALAALDAAERAIAEPVTAGNGPIGVR